jgi:hypothetical protein
MISAEFLKPKGGKPPMEIPDLMREHLNLRQRKRRGSRFVEIPEELQRAVDVAAQMRTHGLDPAIAPHEDAKDRSTHFAIYMHSTGAAVWPNPCVYNVRFL